MTDLISADDIHLYVIEPVAERADHLAAELKPLNWVTVSRDYAAARNVSGEMDAIFVPLMLAIEWSTIQVPAPFHTTYVVEVPTHEIGRFHSKYAIPGIALYPGETLGSADCTRLVLSQSFLAIHRFNQSSSHKLTRIGADSLSLGLDKLTDGEAATLLGELSSGN